MTYMIHPDTVGEDGTTLQIITCIVILFSVYSLISLPIPESTPYPTNDSFSLFSHHYQRIEYSIILGMVFLGYNLWWQDTEANADKNTWESPLIPGIHWSNLTILILQIIGVLGNPYVTIVWFLEQIDIFTLGSTSRASDIRICLSCAINLAMNSICIYVVGDNSSLCFIYGLLAYIASRNILFSIGLRKPFKV